jgi:hypothetical protein
MVKRQESGAEKASSKDSAYGYSGGETSRHLFKEKYLFFHNILVINTFMYLSFKHSTISRIHNSIAVFSKKLAMSTAPSL